MAQKKSAPTDEELSAMFEGIGDDDSGELNLPSSHQATITTTTTATTNTATSSKKPTPASTEADDDDPLAELANLAAAPRLSTSSRPDTPSRFTRTRSPIRRSDMNTPTTGSGRSSEEKAAMLEPDQKALRAPQALVPQQQPEPQRSSGGGWWGGFSALASAAVTQAQAAVKEIQKNEEAQKWAEQVKGNVGNLKGFGLNDIRSRALPAFTNILHTLAPPISQHERLQIHITHDLIGYPSLDPLVYQVFSRIMAQVEGGDLLVIQKGSESTQRRMSDIAYDGGSNSAWADGPWWRQPETPRSISAVKGLVEGSKLARVSAESYSTEFFNARGGLDEAAKNATAILTESNPVRSSDIFVSIQAISHTSSTDYFGGASNADASKTPAETVVIDESGKPDELLSFAVFLHDPIHNIAFGTMSQSFPEKWSEWIDAESTSETEDGLQLPDSILEIIESGGVDPREWVAEWMEEILSTAVGVVAQRYVARRMGVGEGGIGRGKRREMVVESGGGEAARAI